LYEKNKYILQPEPETISLLALHRRQCNSVVCLATSTIWHA